MCETILKRRLEWNDHVIQSLKEEDRKSIMCSPCNNARKENFRTKNSDARSNMSETKEPFISRVHDLRLSQYDSCTQCTLVSAGIILAKTTATWW